MLKNKLMSEILRNVIEQYPGELEQAEEIFGDTEQYGPKAEILQALCEGDETLEKLLEDMLDSCYRYTKDVFETERMVARGIEGDQQAEEYAALDKQRTLLHNATIDNVNILSRALAKAGKDNTWIEPIYSGGRPAYTRFALFTTFREYLKIKQQQEQGGSQ